MNKMEESHLLKLNFRKLKIIKQEKSLIYYKSSTWGGESGGSLLKKIKIE
jgi:hypothetical protein